MRLSTSTSAALVAGLFGAAILLPARAGAQQAGVAFTVSGNSTIRGWTCTVPGTAEVTPGSAAPAPGFGEGVQAAVLTVRVADFECPDDEMREHLLEAMRAEEFPEITFTLEGYEPAGQGAVTTGSLTILDTTEQVSFPLAIRPSGGGVQLEGELSLDMTAYGVEPPRVMLGLLVVRPQVRIELSGTMGG